LYPSCTLPVAFRYLSCTPGVFDEPPQSVGSELRSFGRL
jgi:hypothetical protein